VALVEMLCCLPCHPKPTRGEGGERKRKPLTLNKSHHFQHYFGRATLVIHIVIPTVILDATLLSDLQNKILNKHPSLKNGMGVDVDPSNILERSSRGYFEDEGAGIG
jgi:hypothetical protein